MSLETLSMTTYEKFIPLSPMFIRVVGIYRVLNIWYNWKLSYWCSFAQQFFRWAGSNSTTILDVVTFFKDNVRLVPGRKEKSSVAKTKVLTFIKISISDKGEWPFLAMIKKLRFRILYGLIVDAVIRFDDSLSVEGWPLENISNIIYIKRVNKLILN